MEGICLKQEDTDTPNNVVNLFIFYELDRWSRDLNNDFSIKVYLFGTVKLTKNAGPDKYKYSGYGIELDSGSEFSLSDGSIGKNVVIFGIGMSPSSHIDNKKKSPIQGLDDAT